jgi:antitoxin component YwqK of YwqJK toxin-antitoxin module
MAMRIFSLMLLTCLAGCGPDLQKTRSHYESGMLKSESSYYFQNHNGSHEQILHGKHTTWYPNGKPHTESFYVDGKLNGTATNWWPNGIVRIRNHFNQNGLVDGEQSVYDIQGHLLKSYRMTNGTGTEYIFHDNGTLKYEINWQNGVRHGFFKHYDRSGNLKEARNFKNGSPADPE